jgi:hypothetical protein
VLEALSPKLRTALQLEELPRRELPVLKPGKERARVKVSFPFIVSLLLTSNQFKQVLPPLDNKPVHNFHEYYKT